MKPVKLFITLTSLFLGLTIQAQNPNSDGVYTTNFGNITLTTEYSSEFPGGYGITYGDYKDKGTITGNVGGSINNQELTGTFYNGATEGKFIFLPKNKELFKNTFSSEITGFSGFWGYNSDNKYSSNPNDKWDGTRAQKGVQAIQNVTNVWSGKWNTTDGAMYLNQVANRIVGTYKGVGTIKASYNPSTRILKGTFKNNNFNKTGYLEFYFEGNTFKGKWGWTTAMTEGNWDGTKDIKNNKELSKLVVPSSPNPTTKYIVSAVSITASNNDNYGFFGCKLFKVTTSGRQEISNFGNKSSNFYNTTENDSNRLLSKNQNFLNTPEYFREFILNNTDLNNSQIKFELEIYTHMKAKTVGTNLNYGYKKEVFRIDQIKLNEHLKIISYASGSTLFGQGACTINFKVTKN